MTTDTNNAPRRKDDAHPDRELTWTEPAPADAQLVDVMIDIETLGTTPGSAILSIGAVMFGPAGLGEEFYAPISLASCTEAGLTIDPGTVAWWMKQSDAARAAAFRDNAEPLAAVLEQFTCWLNLVEAEKPWAQGANFDPPLLEAAYRACGMTPPWKFWNVRDTRTLYDLAGVKVDRARGTHHNALDDARAQAEAAVVALQRLRDVSSPGAAVAPSDAEGADLPSAHMRAIDTAYPVPDSPHQSVVQRAMDNRIAFRNGWDAAIAATKPAAPAAPTAKDEQWTKTPPTEQADYWNWDGDPDHAPMIYHVLWSGTAKKCFVSLGQYGIENAIWCDMFGGWWLKIEQPSVPVGGAA
jgi:hypothetical protein